MAYTVYNKVCSESSLIMFKGEINSDKKRYFTMNKILKEMDQNDPVYQSRKSDFEHFKAMLALKVKYFDECKERLGSSIKGPNLIGVKFE